MRGTGRALAADILLLSIDADRNQGTGLGRNCWEEGGGRLPRASPEGQIRAKIRTSRGAMVILEGKETRKFKGESSRPASGWTCPLRETKRERGNTKRERGNTCRLRAALALLFISSCDVIDLVHL